MPRMRLMLNSPAASAAPVPPAHTSACAAPDATARAACTIEASGLLRAASAGSELLAIETGASTISSVSEGSPSCARGPNRITRAPPATAIAAPAATSAGPRSAPLQSTATTGAEKEAVPGDTRVLAGVGLVVRLVGASGNHLAAGIGPAHRTHAMRPARAVTARALVQRGRRYAVLRAALGGAAVRLLFLGDGHRPRKASSPPAARPAVVCVRARSFELQLAQLGPARVRRALVTMRGTRLVEVGGAHGT